MSRFAPVRLVVALLIPAVFAAKAFAQPKPTELKPLWSIRDDDEKMIVEKLGRMLATGSTTWIADPGKMQLTHLDATGKPIGSIGRKGSGPGEFMQINWFDVGSNDSVYVWDEIQSRMSIFAPNGMLARTELLKEISQRTQILGRTSSGLWLVESIKSPNTMRGGVAQESVVVSVAASLHGPLKKILSLPGNSSFFVPGGRGTSIPFVAITKLTGCEGGFVVSGGKSQNVRAYDANGRLLRDVLPKFANPAMSDAARSASLEGSAAYLDSGGGLGARKQLDRLAPNPASRPIDFQIGRDGRIWFQAIKQPFGWAILDIEGRSKMQVPIPSMFSTGFDEDSAVGQTFDADGTRTAARYALPFNARTPKKGPNLLHPALGRCSSTV
ncbi:MAG: 6-bladed beta-propeller [Gemmatimonadaceae bacterium]